MSAHSKTIFVLFLVILATTSRPVAAQNIDQNDALKQIAAQNAALSHIATIYRLSEDLAFWQGVAVMGEKFDWSFSYNTSGTEIVRWTIRLSNVSDDEEIEAKRASSGVARNRYLTDDEKIEVGQLYAKYAEMLSIAREMHTLLSDKRISDAASLFEKRQLNFVGASAELSTQSQLAFEEKLAVQLAKHEGRKSSAALHENLRIHRCLSSLFLAATLKLLI